MPRRVRAVTGVDDSAARIRLRGTDGAPDPSDGRLITPSWIEVGPVTLRRGMTAALAVVSVALVGGSGSVAAAPAPDPMSTGYDCSVLTVPSGVNARGETYGTEVDVTDQSKNPDLMAIMAFEDDVCGYVRKSDLTAIPLPNNPAEAIVYMRLTAVARPIPVYAADGVTVIGHTELGGQ